MALQADQSETNFATLRLTMVECQIRTFGITDHAVIARFLSVPREKFVPASARSLAYSDTALKIADATQGAAERRLLPPLILARLIQAAEIKPSDRVLDIAPGTGYSTAILAGLAQNVVALNSDSGLQAATKANLAAVDLGAVPVFGGPLRDGVASAAPFDVIFVKARSKTSSITLFAQLRDGGRLIDAFCELRILWIGSRAAPSLSKRIRARSASGRCSALRRRFFPNSGRRRPSS